MNEWKAYQVWSVGMNKMVYMVGRKIKSDKPVSDSNVEWNGFYSTDPNEAIMYAKELNKEGKE